MFSLWRTSLADLSEFGTGHQLYFAFLRFMAFTFAVLTVVLGVPLAIVYIWNGSFYSDGTFRQATFGNYGPVYAEGVALADGVVRKQLHCACCTYQCKCSHHVVPLALPNAITSIVCMCKCFDWTSNGSWQ